LKTGFLFSLYTVVSRVDEPGALHKLWVINWIGLVHSPTVAASTVTPHPHFSRVSKA
jgi:hypothetical protein